MKTLTLFFLLFTLSVFSQSNFEKFKSLIKDNDTVGQIKLLKEWEISNENDPELYTSYFNYYFTKSNKSLISIQKESNGKEEYQLKDSEGFVAGYITEKNVNIDKYLKKSFEYIDKGILKFPNRLDMRFGKIYVLGVVKDYENFTNEIIRTIDFSNENKNNWTWTNNIKKEDAEQFLLDAIQEYNNQLYNTNNDSLLENMKAISETVLKYYPKSIENLSNISITYLLQKQYDKALEFLLKAEKINQNDIVVLANIAQAYKLKDDKINSIKYYELMQKNGNNDDKNFAKEQIEKLKKL